MPGNNKRRPPGGRGLSKTPARQNAARGRIDLVIDEVDDPLAGKALFALQSHEDGNLPAAVGLDQSRVDGPPHPQHRRFVDVDVGVHGIERNDGGQQGLVLGDEVAEREVIAAHLAVDGRGHLAEIQIELVGLQAGLGGFDLGIRLVDRRAVLVELLRADRPGRVASSCSSRASVTWASLSWAL